MRNEGVLGKDIGDAYYGAIQMKNNIDKLYRDIARDNLIVSAGLLINNPTGTLTNVQSMCIDCVMWPISYRVGLQGWRVALTYTNERTDAL